MSRRICIALVCLALGWASNVNLAAAQSPGKPADKMVRVTYDVADLIVPIEDHTTFGERTPEKEGRGITKHTVALALVKRITDTVARETWESAGGKASIQYFPMSMAIVVNHREDVQKEIARLLTDLRRLGDVRVSMNVRLVGASPPMAKQLRAFMDAEGQPVRAWNIEKPAHVGRFVSVDDKQVLALLELAQNDRTAHIMQAPKLTIYNGQQAYINSRIASDGPGLRFDVWPTVAADRKSVRFCLHLELAQRGKKSLTTTEAIGAFAVPANRSLIWHIGDTLGQHLFIVATPRVIIVEEEENIFLGNIPPIPGCGNAEEQSVPEPKKPANQPNAKERAIQHRLSQPISLNFKDVPLREAIKEITIASGILVVPDLQSLKEAKVNLDYPVSGSVDHRGRGAQDHHGGQGRQADPEVLQGRRSPGPIAHCRGRCAPQNRSGCGRAQGVDRKHHRQEFLGGHGRHGNPAIFPDRKDAGHHAEPGGPRGNPVAAGDDAEITGRDGQRRGAVCSHGAGRVGSSDQLESSTARRRKSAAVLDRR
jgi:hypothetical protein